MVLFIIVVLAAIAFEYINGFHDAANAIATVVSTKVLTPRQAIALAAFFNLTGASPEPPFLMEWARRRTLSQQAFDGNSPSRFAFCCNTPTITTTTLPPVGITTTKRTQSFRVCNSVSSSREFDANRRITGGIAIVCRRRDAAVRVR